MNAIDLLTIYFAGGAPFAVYYFLQNRRGKIVYVLLKTTVVFLFWIVFAVSLLRRDKNRRSGFGFDFVADFLRPRQSAEKVFPHQKQIENILIKSNVNFSVFDFRETAERYAGLTLAYNSDAKTDFGREIFRAAEQKNDRLGAICLRRRNRSKLARHQIEARLDFLQIVGQLSDSISNAEILRHSASEIAKILNDEAALSSIEKIFAEKLQNGKLSSVEYTEKDLWKPQEPKPLCAETISTRL